MKQLDLRLTAIIALAFAAGAGGALAQTPTSAAAQSTDGRAGGRAQHTWDRNSSWRTPPSACSPSSMRTGRCTRRIPRSSNRWSRTCCCRISMSTTRRGWCSDSRGAPRRAEQRQRFVKAFYHSLLQNYGNALLNFTAGNFTVLPYKGDPGETQATVRTEVKKSDGEKVPVNFRLAQDRRRGGRRGTW